MPGYSARNSGDTIFAASPIMVSMRSIPARSSLRFRSSSTDSMPPENSSMLSMASRMWWRYARSFGVIDHHGIMIDCIGKVGAHSVLGNEIHLHAERPGKLILDPHERKEAFFTGKPDQDIDVARRAGGSPCIGAEDRDPRGIMSGEYRNDRFPCGSGYCASHHSTPTVALLVGMALTSYHSFAGRGGTLGGCVCIVL